MYSIESKLQKRIEENFLLRNKRTLKLIPDATVFINFNSNRYINIIKYTLALSRCIPSVKRVTSIIPRSLLNTLIIIQCGHTHIRLYNLSVIDTRPQI